MTRTFRKFETFGKLESISLPDKINRQYQEYETYKVIPLQRFVFEQQECKNRKDQQRDNFLNYFQLHQSEGTAVLAVADAVGRYHETIFHESDEPTGEDEAEQARFLEKFQVLEFQVAVPGECHEDVGEQ